jgi:hypothetical protein
MAGLPQYLLDLLADIGAQCGFTLSRRLIEIGRSGSGHGR